jgi:hypothetical protein
MQKLTLNVEALTVESFQPQGEPGRREGTVDAHAVPNTQQFRCTYFCTYNCTGLPC